MAATTVAAGAEGRCATLEAAAAALLPERGGGSCVLCCGDLEATALGRCDHPVCYRCSTKMRVLCEQRYCAVCREELRQVVFGKKLPAFASITLSKLQHEKTYDIYFADSQVLALYRQLLQHECPRCLDLPAFNLFGDLEQHMRKQHELFCCKLCLRHLKIFTFERKWYSRKDLARHRMQGDPDDTSHRGHPLCKFCDERYLDNDELLKHLRRDHYFCHFCDTDGAQDYYSDYAYLREHFREKHFLCEEGRCSTEQFTHAFRTEIDLKAHKMACHSRNRAEARQNRHIDLQFNYTPRHPRRAEGVVGGEDYEEVDRYHRQSRAGRAGGRGAQQSRRGSWRYKREEEDREVAAAIQASVAAQQQLDTGKSEDREEAGTRGPEEARGSWRPTRTQGEGPGPKEASVNGPVSQNLFPASSPAAGPVLGSSLRPAPVKLKDEDFPSLCASTSSASALSVTSGPHLAYPPRPRGRGAFQEEDFPALVPSAAKPTTAPTSLLSAWNSSKKGAKPSPGALAARKAGKGGKGGKKGGLGPTEEESPGAPPVGTGPTLLASGAIPSFTKVGKRKKVGLEKQGTPSPPPPPSEQAGPPGTEHTRLAPSDSREGPAGVIVNGHSEAPALARGTPKEPPGLLRPPGPAPQEDFPVLGSSCPPRMPPPPGGLPATRWTAAGHGALPHWTPGGSGGCGLVASDQGGSCFSRDCHPSGFSPGVVLKTMPPPPPPGLVPPVSKPPPGFSSLLSGSHSSSSAKVPRPPEAQAYLEPKRFRERNLQLIRAIKDFLQSDETRFSQFKSHSGEFRQGVISAAQYYQSCQDLLGDNFPKIFNELLVLLPDATKQQELLSAHTAFRGRAQPGTKARRNKKSAWQAGGHEDLACCVCPTCQQVLAHSDVDGHRALHAARNDDDFPSLQALGRVIT